MTTPSEGVPQLKNTAELVREDKLESLRKSPKGFVFEERDGAYYISFLGVREKIGGEYEDHIVEFRTEITNEEQMKETVADILPSPLIRKIWTFLIDSYNQHEIPLIQSLPGTGKTHAFHRFVQLLHGETSRATKEDLLCTPRTSELEILGKWVQNGDHGIGREEIRQKLNESSEWTEFLRVFQSRLDSLYNEREQYTEDVFEEKRAELDKEYQDKQLEILMSTFPNATKGQWRFEEGALVRAYQDPSNPDDQGGFLLVDEVDNLPENYQNIFLQISGEGGKLASKFTSYSGSSKTVYRRGPNTYVGFAANYPEFAPGKRSISAPLADRVTWLSITPEEARRDEKTRIQTFGFEHLADHLPQAGEREIEAIRSLCARTLAAFHLGWKESFASLNKIDGLGGKEMTRDQNKEFSQRTTARVERFVLGNLDNPEFQDTKTGKPDITKLLEYAIRVQYFKYLASEPAKRKAENEILLPLLYGGRKYLEKKGDTWLLKEQPELKEGEFTFVEDAGTFRPYDSKTDKGKKVLAFDEAIDASVQRAFRSPAERKESLEKKRKAILDFDIAAALSPEQDSKKKKSKEEPLL